MSPTRLIALMLALFASACGKDGGSNPAGPTPGPVQVTFNLEVFRPAATAASFSTSALNGPLVPHLLELRPTRQQHQLGIRGSVTTTIGDLATAQGQCRISAEGLREAVNAAIDRPQFVRYVVVETDYPPPSINGIVDCTVTGTDPRGNPVTASRQVGWTMNVDTTPFLSTCTRDAETMCLSRGRIRATASFREFAELVPARVAEPLLEDGGYFYFKDSNARDVFVRLFDECERENTYRAIIDAVNFATELRVYFTNTLTGVSREIFKPLGEVVTTPQVFELFPCTPR